MRWSGTGGGCRTNFCGRAIGEALEPVSQALVRHPPKADEISAPATPNLDKSDAGRWHGCPILEGAFRQGMDIGVDAGTKPIAVPRSRYRTRSVPWPLLVSGSFQVERRIQPGIGTSLG